MQLQALDESMNRARERRLLIERQIADAAVASAEVDDTARRPTPAAARAATVAAAARSGARAAGGVRAALHRRPPGRARARSSDSRPARRSSSEEATARSATGDPDEALSPAEAGRQKRLRICRPSWRSIDRQLAIGPERKKRSSKATIGGLSQAKIDVVPTPRIGAGRADARLRTLQATYASLLQKREDSKMAANLERRQIGEQFRILDPASFPSGRSTERQRLAVMFGGPCGGLVLGLLLVGFLEFRDSSFKTEDDVLRVLSLPVLGADSGDGPEGPASARRHRKRRGAAISGFWRSASSASPGANRCDIERAPHVPEFYGLRELPFELTANPKFPVSDAAASRGAEQPAVRPVGRQGA